MVEADVEDKISVGQMVIATNGLSPALTSQMALILRSAIHWYNKDMEIVESAFQEYLVGRHRLIIPSLFATSGLPLSRRDPQDTESITSTNALCPGTEEFVQVGAGQHGYGINANWPQTSWRK